jgi:cobalt-zinc-cadmium efflux system membrane fusion protein
MKMIRTKFLYLLLLAAVIPFVVSCSSSPKQASASTKPEESEAPKQAGADSSVRLTKEMLPSITTVQLKDEQAPLMLSATGKVQFNEDRTSRVLAPVSGRVTDLSIQIGDRVTEGEILFSLRSREVAAAVSDFLQSEKDRDLSEKTYQMTKDLYDHQAASRMALQQTENDLAKNTAAVTRNQESLRVLGLDPEKFNEVSQIEPQIPVRSALSGTVIERAVTNGQFVQPDPQPLAVIADLSSVWVLADIFEQDLNRIKVNQKAEVTTAAYPNDRFTARVARISDVVDPMTHTVKVRFLVSNPGGRLKPEMFANVMLYVEEAEKGLMLPAEAVFVQDGKSYVYVQTGDGEFSKREVEVMADGEKKLRVIRGLKHGETVVTKGAMLLTQAGGTGKGNL